MAIKRKATESGAGNPHLHNMRVFSDDGHVRPLLDIEQEVVRLSLAKNHGNIAKAAAELGIARSTLYRYAENQVVGASPQPPGRTRKRA
jgi:transcriptional regulator of acetoin/glycerol metabolism